VSLRFLDTRFRVTTVFRHEVSCLYDLLDTRFRVTTVFRHEVSRRYNF